VGGGAEIYGMLWENDMLWICVYATVYDDKGNEVAERTCPFCRTPNPDTDDEVVQRTKQRMAVGDAMAINYLGSFYSHGGYGFPQDNTKALELWHKAGELGCAAAYNNIGACYNYGEGVEVNQKKALHYHELAAMQGHAEARYNLGCKEGKAGNIDRALKHFIIAAGSGDKESLNYIQDLYKNGHATKDDYSKALKSYQSYMGEIKSEKRDEAAAAHDSFKYYE